MEFLTWETSGGLLEWISSFKKTCLQGIINAKYYSRSLQRMVGNKQHNRWSAHLLPRLLLTLACFCSILFFSLLCGGYQWYVQADCTCLRMYNRFASHNCDPSATLHSFILSCFTQSVVHSKWICPDLPPRLINESLLMQFNCSRHSGFVHLVVFW